MISCNVIGCRWPAAWKRSQRLAEGYHDYLCDQHFEVLKQTRPLVAQQYELLDCLDSQNDAFHNQK